MMKKRIIFTVSGILLLILALGGIKSMQFGVMMAMGENFAQPPTTVTATEVQPMQWENTLHAIGSVDAVKGVQLQAELPGKVVEIAFKPGTQVKAGALLVKQDTSSEQAQLRAAEAAAKLAHINRERSTELLAKKMISQADFDSASAQYQQAIAQADAIRATIAKKTIRAPFAGRLGTRQIQIGQTLREGETVVSLQTLGNVFINFQLPQQALTQIKNELTVRISGDTLKPNQHFIGRIVAIDPEVDRATRNVKLQAIAENHGEKLLPGMFVNVEVILPKHREVLAIPATAVLYAPYGDSVFVIETQTHPDSGQEEKVLRQQFVRLGITRGDFVAVDSGIQSGTSVVTTGVFKLRNGQAVVIDNSLQPEFKLEPTPEDS